MPNWHNLLMYWDCLYNLHSFLHKTAGQLKCVLKCWLWANQGNFHMHISAVQTFSFQLTFTAYIWIHLFDQHYEAKFKDSNLNNALWFFGVFFFQFFSLVLHTFFIKLLNFHLDLHEGNIEFSSNIKIEKLHHTFISNKGFIVNCII